MFLSFFPNSANTGAILPRYHDDERSMVHKSKSEPNQVSTSTAPKLLAVAMSVAVIGGVCQSGFRIQTKNDTPREPLSFLQVASAGPAARSSQTIEKLRGDIEGIEQHYVINANLIQWEYFNEKSNTFEKFRDKVNKQINKDLLDGESGADVPGGPGKENRYECLLRKLADLTHLTYNTQDSADLVEDLFKKKKDINATGAECPQCCGRGRIGGALCLECSGHGKITPVKFGLQLFGYKGDLSAEKEKWEFLVDKLIIDENRLMINDQDVKAILGLAKIPGVTVPTGPSVALELTATKFETLTPGVRDRLVAKVSEKVEKGILKTQYKANEPVEKPAKHASTSKQWSYLAKFFPDENRALRMSLGIQEDIPYPVVRSPDLKDLYRIRTHEEYMLNFNALKMNTYSESPYNYGWIVQYKMDSGKLNDLVRMISPSPPEALAEPAGPEPAEAPDQTNDEFYARLYDHYRIYQLCSATDGKFPLMVNMYGYEIALPTLSAFRTLVDGPDKADDVVKRPKYGVLGPCVAHPKFLRHVDKNCPQIAAEDISNDVKRRTIWRNGGNGAYFYGDTFRKHVMQYLRDEFETHPSRKTGPWTVEPWDPMVQGMRNNNGYRFYKGAIKLYAASLLREKCGGVIHDGASYAIANDIIENIGAARVHRLLTATVAAFQEDESFVHDLMLAVNSKVFVPSETDAQEIAKFPSDSLTPTNKKALRVWLATVMVYVSIGAFGGPHEIFLYCLLSLSLDPTATTRINDKFGIVFVNYFINEDTLMEELPKKLIGTPKGDRVPVTNRELYTLLSFLHEAQDQSQGNDSLSQRVNSLRESIIMLEPDGRICVSLMRGVPGLIEVLNNRFALSLESESYFEKRDYNKWCIGESDEVYGNVQRVLTAKGYKTSLEFGDLRQGGKHVLWAALHKYFGC